MSNKKDGWDKAQIISQAVIACTIPVVGVLFAYYSAIGAKEKEVALHEFLRAIEIAEKSGRKETREQLDRWSKELLDKRVPNAIKHGEPGRIDAQLESVERQSLPQSSFGKLTCIRPPTLLMEEPKILPDVKVGDDFRQLALQYRVAYLDLTNKHNLLLKALEVGCNSSE